jgi:hypothetical protein
MKKALLVALTVLWQIAGSVLGDELKIEFPESAAKAFGDRLPLSAKIIRKDGEIQLWLSNDSTKHLVITKDPEGFNGHYEAANGSNLGKFGGASDSGSIEFLDHVVLRPDIKKENAFTFSSWKIWEIATSHDNASACVFELHLGGYFPSIGKYLRFTVTGRLELGINNGEQAGAEQPATRSESKPEGSDKPQPESEGRSR